MSMSKLLEKEEDTDGWGDVEYTCIHCDHKHHPSERVESDVFVGRTLCPKCDGKRALVTHDLDEEITYDSVNIQPESIS